MMKRASEWRSISAVPASILPENRMLTGSRVHHDLGMHQFLLHGQTETIVAHRDGCSCSWSRTSRTARVRTSGENLLLVCLLMAPPSQELEPPANPGQFSVATVKATVNEIEASIAIQNEGFENLIRESDVTMEQVLQRAPFNWYIESQEALSLGLIKAVL
jgi:hypothetical protein